MGFSNGISIPIDLERKMFLSFDQEMMLVKLQREHVNNTILDKRELIKVMSDESGNETGHDQMDLLNAVANLVRAMRSDNKQDTSTACKDIFNWAVCACQKEAERIIHV